jgi:hypothetical protein
VTEDQGGNFPNVTPCSLSKSPMQSSDIAIQQYKSTQITIPCMAGKTFSVLSLEIKIF